jgi:hypothetical protein
VEKLSTSAFSWHILIDPLKRFRSQERSANAEFDNVGNRLLTALQIDL